MEKMKIRNMDEGAAGGTFECLFNPTEYTIAKSIDWDATKQTGKNQGKSSFTGGSPRTLNMELMFDVSEKKGGDVRKEVDKLWKLACVDDSHKTKSKTTKMARPPICKFEWGGNHSFDATITSLSVRYTLFSTGGIPVRAIATVALKEYKDPKEQKKQNPTSFSEAGITTRELRPGDSLPLIAFEEFGDSTLWRRIAEANGIDNPFVLESGTRIGIPRL